VEQKRLPRRVCQRALAILGKKGTRTPKSISKEGKETESFPDRALFFWKGGDPKAHRNQRCKIEEDPPKMEISNNFKEAPVCRVRALTKPDGKRGKTTKQQGTQSYYFP